MDIHGKIDRKDNMEIDLGIAPMEELWKGEGELVDCIKKSMKAQIDSTFKAAKGKFTPQCQVEPFLHALWGYDDLFTISH